MEQPETADKSTVSTAEILAALESSGWTASDHQLERWRGSGLLPEAVSQPGRGQGLGRSEARYPPVSIAQAQKILELLEADRDITTVGWNLWLFGFDVEDSFWRPHFQNAALCFEAVRTKSEKLLDVDGDDDKFSEFAKDLFEGKAGSKTFRNARKDIGRKRFAGLADALLDVACGRLSVRDPEERDRIAELVRPIFGKMRTDDAIKMLSGVSLTNRFGDARSFFRSEALGMVQRARLLFQHVFAAGKADVIERRAQHLSQENPVQQAALILALAMVLKRSNNLESGPRRAGY